VADFVANANPDKIVNGVPASYGDFPYMVKKIFSEDTNNSNTFEIFVLIISNSDFDFFSLFCTWTAIYVEEP